MQTDILVSLTRLSDRKLLSRMKDLIVRERDATAELIAHLAEMDTRDIHLREGYPSLFAYCRDVLRLSEWESYNRIEVARTVRRFPMILGLIADGSVHLTAVKLLAPHLTPENHRHVLDSARGKTKAEVEKIVARLAPQPDVGSRYAGLPHRCGPFRRRSLSRRLPIRLPQSPDNRFHRPIPFPFRPLRGAAP
jgi:hypothetical protein